VRFRATPVSAAPEDSILQSYLSLGGGVILARIVAFIGTAYLARTLGSYAFGIVGFATTITAFLAIAVRNAFDPVGAREVARTPAAASPLAAGVAVIKAAIVMLAIIALALVAAALDKPAEVKLVVLLSGLTLLPLAVDTRWVYRGLARNRWVGASMVLAQIIYVLCLLTVVKAPADVLWVLPALALGELVGACYLALPLLREWNWKVDLERAWNILRSSGFLVASSILGALTRTVDVILIALLLGEAQVGLYSAAYRICFLLAALALALHSAYLPRLARAAADSIETTTALTQRAFQSAASLAVPCAIGGWILAGPMLENLFGEPFTPARNSLRLLLVAMGILFLDGVLLQILVVFDRTRPELLIRGIAAGLNLVLNLLWIPRYGIEGAAMATVLAEISVLLLRLLVGRRLGVRIGGRFLLKPLLASAVMAGVMLWIGPHIPWWVTFLTGGVTYLVSLAALRGLPQDLIPGKAESV
jgi:O-antigen/teichoic acid export membrane protein